MMIFKFIFGHRWAGVMGTGGVVDGDHPQSDISYDEVETFLDKINDNVKNYEYRLPSEAEWEFAERAGSTTRFSNGDDDLNLSEIACYSLVEIQDVEGKNSNNLDLYDMQGNAREWVEDWYVAALGHDPVTDPPLGEALIQDSRVIRGCGYDTSSTDDCRSAGRSFSSPSNSSPSLGFRLVMEP
jgi:formylglycine-generating enzyme required for sulfatase activity